MWVIRHNIPNLHSPGGFSASIMLGRRRCFKNKEFFRGFMKASVHFPLQGPFYFPRTTLEQESWDKLPCPSHRKWCESLNRRQMLWPLMNVSQR